jgi:hypothetical protein
VKQVILKGRRLGKSTLSLEQSILRHRAQLMQRSIDRAILDEIWRLDKYCVHKSWTDRRGRKMHRVGVNDEIYDWLSTVHNQYGKSNPEWWKFEDKINISDKLYLMLVLKFGEGDGH